MTNGYPRTASAANFTVNPPIATVGDYFTLLKPRVMSLVIFTGLAGIVVAPGGVDPIMAFTALLCIAVGAGASGALNMAYDADIDVLMTRTATRPVPMGKIPVGDALGFGWTLAVGSVAIMALFVNLVAAALLAFTIVYYVGFYTLWLKRRTTQNIVIGGLAGALPPAIGWASVTGSVAVAPLVLVLIVFLWTPAHFWALSLYRSEDYARAGVPMLPVVKGKPATRRQILCYAVAVAFAGLLPGAIGFAGPLYMAAAAFFGGLLIWDSVAVYRETDVVHEPAARRLFIVSILYLFVLFASLIAERVLGVAPLGHATFGAWM